MLHTGAFFVVDFTVICAYDMLESIIAVTAIVADLIDAHRSVPVTRQQWLLLAHVVASVCKITG